MNAIRIKTNMIVDNELIIKNLPFKKGKKLEVLILESDDTEVSKDRFPLRSKAIFYPNPLESAIDKNEWNVLGNDPS